MDLEDCLLVREEVLKFIENIKELKKLNELIKLSGGIFKKLYKSKDISEKNQVLLYQDDISFLEFNISGFKEKYFIIHVDDTWARTVLSRLLKNHQFGNYLIITRATADLFLKKAKINSFKSS